MFETDRKLYFVPTDDFINSIKKKRDDKKSAFERLPIDEGGPGTSHGSEIVTIDEIGVHAISSDDFGDLLDFVGVDDA